MSTEIRQLTKNGKVFYPQTHIDAIVGNDGRGVDDEPIVGSGNLVRSGGVAKLLYAEKTVTMKPDGSKRELSSPLISGDVISSIGDASEIDFYENSSSTNAVHVATEDLPYKVQTTLTYGKASVSGVQTLSININGDIPKLKEDINELRRSKSNKTLVVQQTASSVSIEPNVFNLWGEISTLSITFLPGESDELNEYMFQFSCPLNSGTTLTLPNTLLWANDDVLEPEAGYIYQVSVINDLAAYMGWGPRENV